jgi:hypothetical protein
MTDYPPSRRGRTLQFTLIILFAVLAAMFALVASQEPIGLTFTNYVLLAAAAFLPLPFLVYWFYSLNRAYYSLDREKLTLTWGLRVEQIPISDVEWVRSIDSLASPLRMPRLSLPGAILGSLQHVDLGPVEFLASGTKGLLLVATTKRVFVISPQDTSGFMEHIQRVIEMGSLSPISPQSVYPTFVVISAWANLLVRFFWLAGIFLNIGLLVWVTFLIPTLKIIPLGFLPSGAVGEPVPGGGLILLPVLSFFLFLVGWLAGLTFYRSQSHRPLAKIIWSAGVFSTMVFLVAVMYIVTTAV